MNRVFNRLSSVLKLVTSGQELEETKKRLKQARQRNKKIRRRLGRVKQQLEQAKQKNKETQLQLKRTRQKLQHVRKAKPRSKQATRETLLYKMPKSSVCAEIGVHKGEFSKKILDITEPKRLHLIDPWEHQEDDRYKDSRYGGLDSDGQAIMDQRYQKVRELFGKELQAGRVQIHRNYSDVASEEFQDSYFDWIYIDGNHLYEFVKNDLELYYPKIKVNGYMTGDDYGTQNWWGNGVQEAVDEFVAQRPELTLEITGTQYIIRRNI